MVSWNYIPGVTNPISWADGDNLHRLVGLWGFTREGISGVLVVAWTGGERWQWWLLAVVVTGSGCQVSQPRTLHPKLEWPAERCVWATVTLHALKVAGTTNNYVVEAQLQLSGHLSQCTPQNPVILHVLNWHSSRYGAKRTCHHMTHLRTTFRSLGGFRVLVQKCAYTTVTPWFSSTLACDDPPSQATLCVGKFPGYSLENYSRIFLVNIKLKTTWDVAILHSIFECGPKMAGICSHNRCS